MKNSKLGTVRLWNARSKCGRWSSLYLKHARAHARRTATLAVPCTVAPQRPSQASRVSCAQRQGRARVSKCVYVWTFLCAHACSCPEGIFGRLRASLAARAVQLLGGNRRRVNCHRLRLPACRRLLLLDLLACQCVCVCVCARARRMDVKSPSKHKSDAHIRETPRRLVYVCLMCMYASCVSRMCMPYMYALCVCLMCMPYVYALCVCLMCMPYVYALCVLYALCVCLMRMPYVYG